MQTPFLAVLPLTLLAAQALDVQAQPVQPLALAAAQQAVYQQAQQHFRSGRRAAAYGRFAALADAGHAPSAQIALLMQRQGLELFGTAWDATPAQQQRWNALVVNAARGRIDAEDNERGD
jgi:hypothetical protein